METKAVAHTEGPWEVHEVGIVVPGRGVLAEVYGREREANLRLIAAAPEMLATLRLIAEMDTPTENYREAAINMASAGMLARTAIRRATRADQG